MAFPLLFTLPPSNRHEVILFDPGNKPSLKTLNKQITSTIASSVNCAEFMAKHKPKDQTETIQEIRVHWGTEGRDRKMWPEWTVVTEENLAAILEMLKLGVGRDVLEIKVGKDS